jgi:hypothetical protein
MKAIKRKNFGRGKFDLSAMDPSRHMNDRQSRAISRRAGTERSQ